MNKIEMAKKLYALSNKDGLVSLEDFAQLVFDKDSPQSVVDNFVKEGSKLVELGKLINEVGKLGQALQDSKFSNNDLNNEFSEKYNMLKNLSKEMGYDKYINLI